MLGKKSSRVLAVLGLALNSATVFAAAPAPVNNNLNVFIPNLRPGFELGVAVLALRPGASNLNYVIYNKELPVQSPSWTEQEIEPSYTAAFELTGRYIFQGGKDVKLDWTHLSTSDSSTTSAGNPLHFLGPDYEIGPDGLTIRNSLGQSKFKYDVVNLDVGQSVDFGQHVELRFFGGLSTGFLREQNDATYSGNILTGIYAGPFSTMQEVTSNFTGVGPRFGFDANYIVGNGFSFIGEAAVSALIGSAYSKTSYLSSAQQLLLTFGQTSNYQTINDQNVTQVVPGLDAKLGVDYKYTFNRGGLLTVGVGYQAAVYVNAINQYLPGTLVAGKDMQTGGIFVSTMSHTQSNYSVQGPYLKASFAF